MPFGWRTEVESSVNDPATIIDPAATISDADSLNFGFSRYRMPRGGSMTLASPDGATRYRPFTHEDNEEHGQLWTPPIPTD